jgi:hypothetical protein
VSQPRRSAGWGWLASGRGNRTDGWTSSAHAGSYRDRGTGAGCRWAKRPCPGPGATWHETCLGQASPRLTNDEPQANSRPEKDKSGLSFAEFSWWPPGWPGGAVRFVFRRPNLTSWCVTVSKRRTSWVALACLLTGLLAATVTAPSVSADEGDSDSGGVTVTVPSISYAPHNDVFRVGPYRSRLNVLFNDSGVADPTRLQLLDAHGSATANLTVPRLGHLRVVAGYVVLDPVRGAKGRLSFTYRAASPNGPAAIGHAVVQLFPRVIVAEKDQRTARPGALVTVNVAANDQLIVTGAVTACGPQLFAHPPPRPDPLPVVLPEPDSRRVDCSGHQPRQQLNTAHGHWLVDAHGRVVFRPTHGFHGAARIYYRQASAHPFDLGLASVTVVVRRSGTAVLGTEHSRGGGGSLAATGATVALLALMAVGLVQIGVLLVRLARRRRQPVDLEA